MAIAGRCLQLHGALSPTFDARTQLERGVRGPLLAPNFMPGQSYMSSASPAMIESATVSPTYIYIYCYTYQNYSY